jgi:NTP pyrophosphatase (non-canonical NTP hydrolase)
MNRMSSYDFWIHQRWNGKQPEQQPKGDVPYSPVAAMGLAGETGEVMELLKKHWRDGKHPGEDLLLELGDVLHYLTVLAHAYGWVLGDLMEANVAKLVARDAKRGYVVP